MVHCMYNAEMGEHEFACYKNDNQKQDNSTLNPEDLYFYKPQSMRISNFWSIPTFHEILNLDLNIKDFNARNLRNIYNYKLCDPMHKDKNDLSEFRNSKQIDVIKKHLPTYT